MLTSCIVCLSILIFNCLILIIPIWGQFKCECRCLQFLSLRIFGLKWDRFRTKKTIWRREINFSHVYLALCKDVFVTTVVNYSYTGRFNIAFYKFEDMFYDHK